MAADGVVIDLCSDSDSDSFPSPPPRHIRISPPSRPKTDAKPKVEVTPKREKKPRQDVRTRTPVTVPTAVPSIASLVAPAVAPVVAHVPPPKRPATKPSVTSKSRVVQSSSILDTLNPAQRRAVISSANTVAILAGPGSGKTHTLTSRVVWLVDNLGYRPQDVIVATFTVKAAREMKERIGKVLGDGRERKIVLGTFHSVARRYLATYGKRIGLDPKFSIVDDSDSKAIITRIIKRLDISLDTAGARSWISKKKAKGSIGEEEPARKKPNLPPSMQRFDQTKNLEQVYREYQSHLDRLNLLDYDDLLVKCADLLRMHPSCVSNVQAVLIDEYQDTNGIQFELMKLFAQARNRITVVGDPDQSIYGWRSAEIKNLFRFLNEYPGTEEISLEENYRSSRSILDTSLQVIQQDQKRYQKSLLPVHKKGTRPVLRKLMDANKEADWIVSEIRRATLMCGKMLDHSDIAILIRSAFLSRPIEASLGSAGIPYRMIGGSKFFDRAEIKIVLDYLRVIYQPDNNEALSRIVNVPRRGVGAGTMKALLEEAESEKISLWRLLTRHCRGHYPAKTNLKKSEKKLKEGLIGLVEGIRAQIEHPKKALTLVQTIESLLARLSFKEYIEKTYVAEDEARWANVEEFMSLAREFMNKAGELEDEDELPEVEGEAQEKETSVLAKFLANVSLVSDADKKTEDETRPMVTISTIHAAKGLEWPVVFIPAAYNGSLPHSRSEDADEERRLLFVAMTRAKCLLNISYAVSSSREQDDQELSPFLSSVPSACFSERGPSYNKSLLVEMGEILGRKVPRDSDIYKDLPMGSQLEDDKYPVDPNDAHGYGYGYRDDGDEYGGWYRAGSRAKRRKTLEAQNNIYAGSGTGGVGGGGGAGAGAWQRGYTTTMEGASGFTMSSMPGFTTASAHQTALLAAEAAAAAAATQGDGTRATTTARGKRSATPPGQKKITAIFACSNSTGAPNAPIEIPDSSSVVVPRQSLGFLAAQQPRAVAVPPGISPELTSRRLGGVVPKIKAGHPSVTKAGWASGFSNQGQPASAKRYAHFSSSPTRAESAGPKQEFQQQQQLQPSLQPLPEFLPQATQYHSQFIRPEQPKQSTQYPRRGKENQSVIGKGVGVGPASTAMRPATTLHPNTSYTLAAAGYRRRPPTAAASAGTTAMDKLRRPFKPPGAKRTT